MSPFKTSRRSQTRAREVATPRLDTTISSVGSLPGQKFHAEGYELDYFAEDDGAFESDEDKDVFAFERPVTAAARKMSDRVLQSSMMDRALQEDTKDWQLVSPVDSGFGPKRSASPSGVSVKPSLLTTTSSCDVTNTTDGGFTTDVANESDIYIAKTTMGNQAHRMRCFKRRDPLAIIPGSRDGGSRDTTELAGTTTVPDGATTTGDGQGNLYRRWKAEACSEQGMRCSGEEEDSPYEEVRASVSNIDDPEMPTLTWRVWSLGLFFLISRSAFETIFQFRSPSASFPLLSIQLFVYPLGKLLAWVMPLKKYELPPYLGSFILDLNPGPFNIKENTLIIIMANIVVCPVLQATTAAEVFLGADLHTGFMAVFVLGAQLVGMSLAGFGHRLLVEPASMIWPYNLVLATFLNTFHAEDDVQPGRITRFRFFMIAFVGAFLYYFLPGFLFTALSYFSWICWMKPESRVVNQLFGVATGLGMGVFTFDWTQILYIGSPLMVPWWVQAHAIVGFVVFYWILCPILYYSNVWYTAYMPMSTGAIMDRFAAPYNVTLILNDTRVGCFNETAYHAYSPVYISVTFAMTLTLAFALSTAAVVHTLLYHGPAIWRAIRRREVEKPDIHAKLMRSYPTTPFWWFAGLAAVGGSLSIIGIEIFHTGYPVYMLLVSFLIPLIYFLPAGILLATASQSLAINVMSQLLPGYLVPGNAVVNMLSKSYSLQTLFIGTIIVQDMKLGHYMKIPPRTTFTVQLISLLVTTFTQIVVKNILFSSVPGICQPSQGDSFTCPYTSVWYHSGIIWGSLGPARLFGNRALYHPSSYAALIGAVLPIPFWLIGKKCKRGIWRMVHFGVLLNSVLNTPPATGANYASFFLVGFIFQYLIRRKAPDWWSRFNYTLSAALDLGTLLSVLFILLALGVPNVTLNWVGNTIYRKTYDWLGMPYLNAPAEGFGPQKWV